MCRNDLIIIDEIGEVLLAPEPVFPAKSVAGKDGLFVRNNNTTNVLVGKEALDFVGRRWKK